MTEPQVIRSTTVYHMSDGTVLVVEPGTPARSYLCTEATFGFDGPLPVMHLGLICGQPVPELQPVPDMMGSPSSGSRTMDGPPD